MTPPQQDNVEVQHRQGEGNKIEHLVYASSSSVYGNNKKIPYYKLTHDGKEIVVTCAVGHLYGLAEKKKEGWVYPVYDIAWKPAADMSKASKFTKPYLLSIKNLAKDADEFTVATDYDIEGEVIGLNVIKYACKQK
ncbi:MAG: hypothetical protein IH935_07400, partial [Acidobacteria bacterium]|nr:hypothetical protein [Acidobacteriota bacterium]